MSVRNTLRAFPTLLRVGFSEAVAYRAEMLIWVLATTMPLVMLALWSAVAREAPIGRFGQSEFTAYFLADFIVRHQVLQARGRGLGGEGVDALGQALQRAQGGAGQEVAEPGADAGTQHQHAGDEDVEQVFEGLDVAGVDQQEHAPAGRIEHAHVLLLLLAV